jgi:hypothetical protein
MVDTVVIMDDRQRGTHETSLGMKLNPTFSIEVSHSVPTAFVSMGVFRSICTT